MDGVKLIGTGAILMAAAVILEFLGVAIVGLVFGGAAAIAALALIALLMVPLGIIGILLLIAGIVLAIYERV